jgi:hypothetical protein
MEFMRSGFAQKLIAVALNVSFIASNAIAYDCRIDLHQKKNDVVDRLLLGEPIYKQMAFDFYQGPDEIDSNAR